MNKTVRCILSVCLPLLFIGCSAKGKQFSVFKKPTPGKSLIYIYRPDSMVGYLVSYDIRDAADNDLKLGRLHNNGYIYKEVKPGHKALYGLHKRFQTKFSVREGEVVCLKSFIRPTEVIDGLTGISPLIPVDLKRCSEEIKETYLSQ